MFTEPSKNSQYVVRPATRGDGCIKLCDAKGNTVLTITPEQAAFLAAGKGYDKNLDATIQKAVGKINKDKSPTLEASIKEEIKALAIKLCDARVLIIRETLSPIFDADDKRLSGEEKIKILDAAYKDRHPAVSRS